MGKARCRDNTNERTRRSEPAVNTRQNIALIDCVPTPPRKHTSSICSCKHKENNRSTTNVGKTLTYRLRVAGGLACTAHTNNQAQLTMKQTLGTVLVSNHTTAGSRCCPTAQDIHNNGRRAGRQVRPAAYSRDALKQPANVPPPEDLPPSSAIRVRHTATGARAATARPVKPETNAILSETGLWGEGVGRRVARRESAGGVWRVWRDDAGLSAAALSDQTLLLAAFYVPQRGPPGQMAEWAPSAMFLALRTGAGKGGERDAGALGKGRRITSPCPPVCREGLAGDHAGGGPNLGQQVPSDNPRRVSDEPRCDFHFRHGQSKATLLHALFRWKRGMAARWLCGPPFK